MRRTRKLEGATPVKLLEKQSGETPVSTGEELPLMPVCLMQSIEERVRRLVRSNRQLQSRVSQRNQECLELLSTVKQELTLRG